VVSLLGLGLQGKKTTAERFVKIKGLTEDFLRSKIGQPWGPEIFSMETVSGIGKQDVPSLEIGANVSKARSEIRSEELRGEMVDESLDGKPEITWSDKELARYVGVSLTVTQGLKYWTRVLYTRRTADVERVKALRDNHRRNQMTYELMVAANLLKKMAADLTSEQISELTALDFSQVASTLQTAIEDGEALQKTGRESRPKGSYEQLKTLKESPVLLRIILNKLKSTYEMEAQKGRDVGQAQGLVTSGVAPEIISSVKNLVPLAEKLLGQANLKFSVAEIGKLRLSQIRELIEFLRAVAYSQTISASEAATQFGSLKNVPVPVVEILEELKRIQQAGTSETQTLPPVTSEPDRSELRLSNFEDVITPDEIALIEHFYFSILPMQLRELIEAAGGRKAVLEVLRKIPGVIMSEAAADIPETSVLDGLFAPEASLAISETVGRGLTVAKNVTPKIQDRGGRVFLGQDILAKLTAENPRALFYLLKTYSVFEGQKKSPALLTVGSRQVLLKQIEDALVNRGSGLVGLEIAERHALLQALRQGKILDVIEPAQGTSEAQIVGELAATAQGGFASLHLSADMLPRSLQGVHFAFSANNIGARDLMVASVLAIVLKSVADLIHNVPDAKIKAGLLSKFVAENLPGVIAQAQGNSFVITQITKLAQEFSARTYIATRA
jgi:hypothetical protein